MWGRSIHQSWDRPIWHPTRLDVGARLKVRPSPSYPPLYPPYPPYPPLKLPSFLKQKTGSFEI